MQGGSPLAGIRVVEVSAGVSVVGAGMASCLPGALLRDFGAEVSRVQLSPRGSLDAGVEWARVWNRGKEIIEAESAGDLTTAVRALAADADVVFIAGDEQRVEHFGIGYQSLARSNPRLVVCRIRSSYNGSGGVSDLELLVQARAGLLSQIRGQRPGPVFCDLPVGNAGAALSATAGALACLYRRETTGSGGWVETSIYDGMLTMLSMIVGRVEHPSPSTAAKWITGDPVPALSFRCSDGGYIQLWFGAKGAYEAFLDHIGDPPSEDGYAKDIQGGAIIERSERWAKIFATRERDAWITDLAGHDFRCEPVLRPGEILREQHLRDIGLSVDHLDPEIGKITVAGPVAQVTPVPAAVGTLEGWSGEPGGSGGAGLLSAVRVLDLSAYLAGPVAAMVLAELGADVVKVEPVTGDAHRGIEPMYAAGQRAKRTVALNLKAPGATGVLARLFAWSDVVHHNSRVGLAERLGYDETTVRCVNPDVVYCHASGFGSSGPRALLAANDHLMQALSGTEAAGGGAGNAPTYLDWGAIDIASGWVAACSILAGLYARNRTGVPQSVASTLLGAAVMLKSGAFITDADVVEEGPVLDAGQTGYGAAYRIYQGEDGRWLALAIPDAATWSHLRSVIGTDELPVEPPPLRTAGGDRQPCEEVLERAFAGKAAGVWVKELSAAGIPAASVASYDRAEFVARILDDPVNRQLDRVVAFDWGARGLLEQPSFPARFGPSARRAARTGIAGLGEHTEEVLAELGFEPDEIAAFGAAGVTSPGLGGGTT